MTSRKQKIKNKREQEEQEIQQVRVAVGVFVVLLILGIGAYVLWNSGFFSPKFDSFSELTGTPQEICEQGTPTTGGGVNNQYEVAPDVLPGNADYRAVLCTTQGAIYVDLFEDEAPLTVVNFAFLGSEGFYENTIFHRVLDGFMAQAGDPTGTGTGGPGYRFEDEFDSGLTFDRPYLLAMANSGPGTNGSQFFITFVPTPHLDNAHTIFGEVISGQEVVDSLVRVNPQQPNPNVVPSTLLGVFIVKPDQVTE